MTYESAIQNYFVTVSGFFLDVSQRWRQAREKAQAGTYGVEAMMSDGIALANRAMESWWSLIPSTNASPLLPTIVISAAANAVPGQQLAGSAFLADALPPSPQLSSTSLQQLGGAGSIASADISVGPSTGGIQVTIHVPGGTAPPAAGLYEGLAYEAGLEMPLALIVLKVS